MSAVKEKEEEEEGGNWLLAYKPSPLETKLVFAVGLSLNSYNEKKNQQTLAVLSFLISESQKSSS